MAQMKEQIKTPKTELSDKEIANLSNAEFKTLAVNMISVSYHVTGMLRQRNMAQMKEQIKTPKIELSN